MVTNMFLLALLIILILNSAVRIPAYHFGIIERFGKRIPRVLFEGLCWKVPFVDTVQLISMELGEIPIEVTFTTQDNLSLVAKGSLQYRPDPKVVDPKKGRNVFIEMSEEIIASGIAEAVKAKLGALGGTTNGEEFIGNRHALADMINSFLRLEEPLHLHHKKGDAGTCGLTVDECKFDEEKIDAKKLIEFYNSHWRKVSEVLGVEEKDETRAKLEKLYGIDIKYFALATITFSKETAEALEEEKQAKFRGKAVEEKVRLAKLVKEGLGATAQVALNAVDTTLNPTIKKEVVSVEGDVGVLGALVTGMKGGS